MSISTNDHAIIIRRDNIDGTSNTTPAMRDELSNYPPIQSDLRQLVEHLPVGTPEEVYPDKQRPNQNLLAFKRQLSDKFSAEKC